MQRPTQQYIETCKQFPISTGTAVLVARDRREELNADIEEFLKNGGKIKVIEHQDGRKPIEELMNFNGNSKAAQHWQARAKYLEIMLKHALSLAVLAKRLHISTQTLADYLSGAISPAPHTKTAIQTGIEFMVKEKAAKAAEAKEMLKCCL